VINAVLTGESVSLRLRVVKQRRSSRALSLAVIVAGLSLLKGCTDPAQNAVNLSEKAEMQREAVPTLSTKHFRPPVFTELSADFEFPGLAVWGATGKSSGSRLYFGLSSADGEAASSYLLMHDTVENISSLQSDALTQLKRADLYEAGMRQSTLHSQFMMAPDGLLYFTSMDYSGQTARRNPTWGGHMWRKFPEAENWEHVFETNEALIALNVHERFVYALGYWGHVLYQYDTQSQSRNKITIGAVPGHRSRNFVISGSGHVFVPRTERTSDGSVISTLVELNDKLGISDVHPLPDYWMTNGSDNHGIIAYAEMNNGDVYFTVATGGLYHITQVPSGRHKVNYLGKFDPEFSQSYIASLFSPDGESLIVGLGRNSSTTGYYWFIKELSTGIAVNYPLPELGDNQLLYGSMTTDSEGNMYIAGQDNRDRLAPGPIIYKVSFAEGP
jgi:hypothetical protein